MSSCPADSVGFPALHFPLSPYPFFPCLALTTPTPYIHSSLSLFLLILHTTSYAFPSSLLSFPFTYFSTFYNFCFINPFSRHLFYLSSRFLFLFAFHSFPLRYTCTFFFFFLAWTFCWVTDWQLALLPPSSLRTLIHSQNQFSFYHLLYVISSCVGDYPFICIYLKIMQCCYHHYTMQHAWLDLLLREVLLCPVTCVHRYFVLKNIYL